MSPCFHSIVESIICGKIFNLEKLYSTSKNSTSVIMHGKETLNYWMAKCNSVQKCTKCDHILPNVCIKNDCRISICAIEFVYVFPADTEVDKELVTVVWYLLAETSTIITSF